MNAEGTSASVLVSDAERDRVVEILKQRTADGTLSLDEFAGRIDGALGARTRGDLHAVVVDLPTRTSQEARRVPRHRVLSIMSGAGLKGRWRCSGHVVAVAVMGGCYIDFRGAEIDVDVVHVTAVAVMGGIDIVVPEGVEVTMDGLPVMGGRSVQIKDVPTLPGAPQIVVHAFPIMGGVNVRSRPRKRIAAPATPVIEKVPEPRPLPETPLPADGVATFMFCDLSDYSGITDRLGDVAAHDLLRQCGSLVRAQVAAQGGHEVKSNGDGYMIVFPSVARAVRCASAIQCELAELRDSARTTEPLHMHIGIHAGEVVRDGDDYVGSTVIIASRLADVAGPDEIFVSSVARELTGGSRDFVFDAPRTVSLKGFVDPRQVYPVKWQPTA